MVVDIGFGRRVLNTIHLVGQIVSAIGMIDVDICVDHITHLQVGLAQSQRKLPRVQNHWDHQHAVATDHTTRCGGNRQTFSGHLRCTHRDHCKDTSGKFCVAKRNLLAFQTGCCAAHAVPILAKTAMLLINCFIV